MRKDCALSKLSPEQQNQLYDWLCNDTLAVVQKRVAKPSPDGFGINVHINTLHRFLLKRREEDASRDLANLVASDANSGASQQSAAAAEKIFFDRAAKSFAHLIFQLASAPQSPEVIRVIGHVIFQHKELAIKSEFLAVARAQLELARERLALDKKEFEYNAARAALSILPDLVSIDKQTDIDDEAKVWRARDRLFGPSQPDNAKPAPPAAESANNSPSGPAEEKTAPDDTTPNQS